MACCGYSAVTRDRVTRLAELSGAAGFSASISCGRGGDQIVNSDIFGLWFIFRFVKGGKCSKCHCWGCGASGNVSGVKFMSHSAFYDLWDEPSASPCRHQGGWSPAPRVDSSGRPPSIKIQLPPLTWQPLTFCRGSHWAAGNRLESEWCFSVEDEASPTTVPLRCHSSALPPRPHLSLSILYASLSFCSPSSLSATMHASSS